MTGKRILVAGVGNVLLGDDGFGVEVVRRLRERGAARAAEVRDFGIRGQDLALALLDGWDAVVLVDAARRGKQPGTLSVLEPQPGRAVALAGHALDPASVLATARAMGGRVGRLRLVACEPEAVPAEDEDLKMGLSPLLAACVDPACAIVESLIVQVEVEHA